MKVTIILIIMFSFLSSSAQVNSTAFNLTLKALLSHSVPEVSVSQMKEMKDFVLLDVREKNEYEVSHISNAKHVGYGKFEIASVGSVSKNQKIVVYCSVGYRSEKIGEKLKQAGFTDISNLYGGIFEWVNQGNVVVDKQGKATQNIHAYSKTWGIWLEQGVKVYDTK